MNTRELLKPLPSRPENNTESNIDPLELKKALSIVQHDVQRRTAEITAPTEDPNAKEKAKKEFITFADKVLEQRGVEVDVEIPWQGHTGEGIKKLTGTKRVTPPIQISPTQAIQLTDSEPYALDETHFTRDDMHLLIINLSGPQAEPLKKPNYTFGREISRRNRKSFFDIPGQEGEVKIDDINRATNYLKVIDATAPLVQKEPQTPANS